MKMLDRWLKAEDSSEGQYDELINGTISSALSSVLKEDRAKVRSPNTWRHYLDGANAQESVLIQDKIRKSITEGMKSFAIALRLGEMLPDSSDAKAKFPAAIWKLLPEFGRSLSRAMERLGERAPADLVDLGKDLSALHTTQGPEFNRVIEKLKAFAMSTEPSKHTKH